MRNVGIVAAVVIVVAILIGAVLYVAVLPRSGGAVGFESTSIHAPVVATLEPVDNSIPLPHTSTTPSYDNLNLYWIITQDIYASYGGALELTVENKNNGRLYIYAFGIEWTDDGETYYRNCSVTVDRNEKAELGLLIFGAPSSGIQEYRIMLKLAVSNVAGYWHDYGVVPSEGSTAYVQPSGEEWEVEEYLNTLAYYNDVNERVSYSDAAAVAELVQDRYPGAYSILQIAEAYSWVKDNVEYKTDDSGDYWQSTKETLDLGTGDCEDHAILMASVIGALGGNARVNLIEQHAFPTVFVASTYAGLMQVKLALASYYGVDNATYQMSYLADDLGYWLVIDTTGFPYVGGLPANSEPVSANGNWTVLSGYIHRIDATGVLYNSGLFGIF